MPAQSQSPCKFCEKKGLPILPFRYGIAPTQSFGINKFHGIPPDPTPLTGKPEVAISAPETAYTGRRLRGGWLYVYYQTHEQWEAYAVGEDGCLSQVPVTDTPPGGDRFHAACARDATKVANASVLTIDDPETAGIVWIGFSDAWWTEAIRNKNAGLSDAERAKFMRKVDVAAWFNGGQPGGTLPKHAFQTYEAGISIAEYAMDVINGTIATNFSPFHFHPQSADTLVKECDALIPAKGLILWVQDPVALAMELTGYLDFRWKSFAAPFSRGTTVDAELAQIRAAVERQAVDNLFKETHQAHLDMVSLPGGDKPMPNMALLSSSYRKMVQPALDETVTAAGLAQAQAAAWKPYVAAIDETRRGAFRAKFRAASEAYDAQYMAPLATAHAAWMQSASMTAGFAHHYDPEDINTGVGLTTVFTACVSGTAGYGACLKLYDQWLQAGLKGGVPAMNALWRALIFNHPDLAAKAKATGATLVGTPAKGDVQPGDAWTGLFATFEAVAAHLRFAGEVHAQDLHLAGSDVRSLLAELGAPLTHTIQKRGAAGGDLLATLGMHAGSPVRVVTVQGSLDDVYRAAYDSLDNLQPVVGTRAKIGRIVASDQRMRAVNAELQAAGIDPNAKRLRTWSVLLDTDGVEGAGESSAQSVAARVKLVAANDGAHVLGVDNAAARLVRGLKLPGAIATVSLLLSAVTWHNLGDEAHTALAGEQTRAEAMLWSARSGFVSSAFYLVQTGIEAGQQRPSALLGPLGRSVTARELSFLKGFGAAAGAVSMLVAVVVDIKNAYAASAVDEHGMATLYWTRTAIEGAIALQGAFDVAAVITGIQLTILGGPAVWVALGAIAVVSIAISLLEDPKTLTWARECEFGVKPNAEYSAEPYREQLDFQTAMAS